MIRPPHHIRVTDLGRTAYAGAWDLQRTLFGQRHTGAAGDTLLLTEHEHVYTLGKGSDDDHLLASPGELAGAGAQTFRIDRGGDVTYHGPGQLVGYPILRLDAYYQDVHRYLRDLEEVLIRAIGEFGIDGRREAGMTGVWVGQDKIAALGIKVSHWITMHGFALNVNTDLTYFDRIIPCGIFHKGVTSMARLTGGAPLEMSLVKRSVIRCFGEVFDAEMAETAPEVVA
jgi:lipoyl(octanoyl) transferase